MVRKYCPSVVKPVFESVGGSFRVILPNVNENKKADIVKGNNTQEEQVLEYMREHPRVTRAEIEKLLNVKTMLAYSILKSLESQGKIKTEKNGKSTVYTLA